MAIAGRRLRRWAGALALGLVALLLAPSLAAAAPAPSPSMTPRPLDSSGEAPPVPGISAVVKWGGTSIASATSVSSAIPTAFTHTVDVNFTWVALAGANGLERYNISTARIQFFYFGAALDTRDVVDSTPIAATNGSFDLSWEPGIFQFLFEGTFGLSAILLAPNGTTMWSQSFYIHAEAPYAIGAVLPILLVLIGIYEAYGLATAGQAAATTVAATPPKSGAKPAQEAADTEPSDPPKEGGPG